MSEPTIRQVIEELQREAKNCRNFPAGVGCQSDYAWHASTYQAWADRLLAALAAPPDSKQEDDTVRYCNCADPENCREPIPGRVCRPRKAAPPDRQEQPCLSAPHETAYDEAVMSAYQQAQDNWSAQCFCFTSAPESMRRTAHEVARDGFSEIVKTLGPLARPLLDAEYEAARQRSNFDDCLRCGAEPLNMSQTPDRRIDEGTEIERTRAHQRRRAVDADRALDAGEVAQQGAERH